MSATPPAETTPAPVTQHTAPFGTALKNFFMGFSVSTRASRSEYWCVQPIVIPIMIILGCFRVYAIAENDSTKIMILSLVCLVFAFLYWAALARRINDMGKSGKIAEHAFKSAVAVDIITMILLFFKTGELEILLQIARLIAAILAMIEGLWGFIYSLMPSKMVKNEYGPVPFCD